MCLSYGANDRTISPATRRAFTDGVPNAMTLGQNLTRTGARTFGANRSSTYLAFGLASQESIAMFGNNLVLNHIHADAKRSDLLREVEHDRRLRQAERPAKHVVALAAIVVAARNVVGAALVRAGERLQGAGVANPADGAPSVATLRLAR